MEDDVWLRADIEWRRAKDGVRSQNIRYPRSGLRDFLSAIRYLLSAIHDLLFSILYPLFAPQKLRKSTELFGDTRALQATLVCGSFVHEAKLHGQSIHTANLSRRPFGNIQKAREFCRRRALGAFSDVVGYRDCCSLDLITKRVVLHLGEVPVNAHGQRLRCTPHLHFLKCLEAGVFHRFAPMINGRGRKTDHPPFCIRNFSSTLRNLLSAIYHSPSLTLSPLLSPFPEELVVIRMRSDPEPDSFLAISYPHRAIVSRHTNRPDVVEILDFLESQARMRGIPTPETIGFFGLPNYVGRQHR